MNEKLKLLNEDVDKEHPDIEIPAIIKTVASDFFKNPDLVPPNKLKMLSDFFAIEYENKLKAKGNSDVVDGGANDGSVDLKNRLDTDTNTDEIIN